jgi:xylose isomerase
MYIILQNGGFTTGGLNFDAKVRRQSIDPEDLLHAHIGAMDSFARGLNIASKMVRGRKFEKVIDKRYAGWDAAFGKKIEKGKATFTQMETYTLKNGEPKIQSGRQELLENILNEYIR